MGDPQHPYTHVLLSAIPEADPDKKRNKRHINLRSEDIPMLTQLPAGCTFHTRCPWFIDGVCDTQTSQLELVPDSELKPMSPVFP